MISEDMNEMSWDGAAGNGLDCARPGIGALQGSEIITEVTIQKRLCTSACIVPMKYPDLI